MEMSPERLLFGIAVPVGRVVEADDYPSPIALADALGDRYLCRFNPVYARIREAALAFGYCFSAENTPLRQDYITLPLTTLHRILSERTIPYCNTADTLLRLRETNPHVALSPGFILDSTKRNYTLHEAAHCVAHAVLGTPELAESLKTIVPGSRERSMLEGIFAEAFANTVEKLGTLFRGSPLWDHVFYCLNSYVGPKDKITGVLEKAHRELGEYLRFAVLFAASFEANLVMGQPDDGVRDRVRRAAQCPEGHDEMVRDLVDTGFNLSDVFREYTGPAYFAFLGYTKEYDALKDSLWLDRPENRRFMQDLMPRLFAILSGTPPASQPANAPPD